MFVFALFGCFSFFFYLQTTVFPHCDANLTGSRSLVPFQTATFFHLIFRQAHNRKNYIKYPYFYSKRLNVNSRGITLQHAPWPWQSTGTWNPEEIRAHLAGIYVNQYFLILHYPYSVIYIDIASSFNLCVTAQWLETSPGWNDSNLGG